MGGNINIYLRGKYHLVNIKIILNFEYVTLFNLPLRYIYARLCHLGGGMSPTHIYPSKLNNFSDNPTKILSYVIGSR